jgi:hypothetical protein
MHLLKLGKSKPFFQFHHPAFKTNDPLLCTLMLASYTNTSTIAVCAAG